MGCGHEAVQGDREDQGRMVLGVLLLELEGPSRVQVPLLVQGVPTGARVGDRLSLYRFILRAPIELCTDRDNPNLTVDEYTSQSCKRCSNSSCVVRRQHVAMKKV